MFSYFRLSMSQSKKEGRTEIPLKNWPPLLLLQGFGFLYGEPGFILYQDKATRLLPTLPIT
jgi:hypothetical protein